MVPIIETWLQVKKSVIERLTNSKHTFAAMQNTWLVFLACCALGVLAEDKPYHYKEVPLQATQRAKTPLLINALAPRVPFLSPYYPGVYYPVLRTPEFTYPTHLLTAQPVIARQAPKVAYSIPAEEPSDDPQGRTSPARDYTKYFGVIPSKYDFCSFDLMIMQLIHQQSQIQIAPSTITTVLGPE